MQVDICKNGHFRQGYMLAPEALFPFKVRLKHVTIASFDPRQL